MTCRAAIVGCRHLVLIAVLLVVVAVPSTSASALGAYFDFSLAKPGASSARDIAAGADRDANVTGNAAINTAAVPQTMGPDQSPRDQSVVELLQGGSVEISNAGSIISFANPGGFTFYLHLRVPEDLAGPAALAGRVHRPRGPMRDGERVFIVTERGELAFATTDKVTAVLDGQDFRDGEWHRVIVANEPPRTYYWVDAGERVVGEGDMPQSPATPTDDDEGVSVLGEGPTNNFTGAPSSAPGIQIAEFAYYRSTMIDATALNTQLHGVRVSAGDVEPRVRWERMLPWSKVVNDPGHYEAWSAMKVFRFYSHGNTRMDSEMRCRFMPSFFTRDANPLHPFHVTHGQLPVLRSSVDALQLAKLATERGSQEWWLGALAYEEAGVLKAAWQRGRSVDDSVDETAPENATSLEPFHPRDPSLSPSIAPYNLIGGMTPINADGPRTRANVFIAAKASTWSNLGRCERATTFCEMSIEPVPIDSRRRKLVEVHAYTLTFEDAVAFCAARSFRGKKGTLVSIDSPEEAERFDQLLTEADIPALGGHTNVAAVQRANIVPPHFAWLTSTSLVPGEATWDVFQIGRNCTGGFCLWNTNVVSAASRTAQEDTPLSFSNGKLSIRAWRSLAIVACQFLLDEPPAPRPLPQLVVPQTKIGYREPQYLGSRRIVILHEGSHPQDCRVIMHQGLPGRPLQLRSRREELTLRKAAQHKGMAISSKIRLGGRRFGDELFWEPFERQHSVEERGEPFYNITSRECYEGFYCPWRTLADSFGAESYIVYDLQNDGIATVEPDTDGSVPSKGVACEWSHDPRRPALAAERPPLVNRSEFGAYGVSGQGPDAAIATCGNVRGLHGRRGVLARIVTPAQAVEAAEVLRRESTPQFHVGARRQQNASHSWWVWPADADGLPVEDTVFYQNGSCVDGFACLWQSGHPVDGFDVAIVKLTSDKRRVELVSIPSATQAASLCEVQRGRTFQILTNVNTVRALEEGCARSNGRSAAAIESEQDQRQVVDLLRGATAWLAPIRTDYQRGLVLWADAVSQLAFWNVTSNTCIGYCGPTGTLSPPPTGLGRIAIRSDGTWLTAFMPSDLRFGQGVCVEDNRVTPIKFRSELRRQIAAADLEQARSDNGNVRTGATRTFAQYTHSAIVTGDESQAWCRSVWWRNQTMRGELVTLRSAADHSAFSGSMITRTPAYVGARWRGDTKTYEWLDVPKGSPQAAFINGTDCVGYCPIEGNGANVRQGLAPYSTSKGAIGAITPSDVQRTSCEFPNSLRYDAVTGQAVLLIQDEDPVFARSGDAVCPNQVVRLPLNASQEHNNTMTPPFVVGAGLALHDTLDANLMLRSQQMFRIARVWLDLEFRSGAGWRWRDNSTIITNVDGDCSPGHYCRWATGHPTVGSRFAYVDANAGSRWISTVGHRSVDDLCGIMHICRFPGGDLERSADVDSPEAPMAGRGKTATPSLNRTATVSLQPSATRAATQTIPAGDTDPGTTPAPTAPPETPPPPSSSVRTATMPAATKSLTYRHVSATPDVVEVPQGASRSLTKTAAPAAVKFEQVDVGVPMEVRDGTRATASVATAAVAAFSPTGVTKPSLAGRGLRLLEGACGAGLADTDVTGSDEWPSALNYIATPEVTNDGDSEMQRGAGAILTTVAASVAGIAAGVWAARHFSTLDAAVPSGPSQADDATAALWRSTVAHHVVVSGCSAICAYYAPSLVEAGIALLVGGAGALQPLIGAVGLLVAVGMLALVALGVKARSKRGTDATSSSPLAHFVAVVCTEICGDATRTVDRAAVILDFAAAEFVGLVVGLQQAGVLTEPFPCRVATAACAAVLCALTAFLVVRRPYPWRAEQLVVSAMTAASALLWLAILLYMSVDSESSRESLAVAAGYIAVGVDLSSVGGAAVLAVTSLCMKHKKPSSSSSPGAEELDLGASRHEGGGESRAPAAERKSMAAASSAPLLEVPVPHGGEDVRGGRAGGGSSRGRTSQDDNPPSPSQPKPRSANPLLR